MRNWADLLMGVSITAGTDYKEPRKRVQKPMRLLGMMRPWTVGPADVQVPGRLVEPLSEERERHNVSHLPPQSWCEHCVRGRAPEGDHKRVTFEQADRELPVIAFDFAFLKTSQGSGRTIVADAHATQLVAVDVDSGMIRVVPDSGEECVGLPGHGAQEVCGVNLSHKGASLV